MRSGGKEQEAARQLMNEQHRQRCHNPMHGTQPEAPSSTPTEVDPEGPLALIPEELLDHVMSLLAAEVGGSCIRSTCRWLRSAFDRCNSRLVLRGTHQQLPNSFPARLLDVVRYSPCVSSLTLAQGLKCVTWAQVLEAGGPQLLHRLERLELLHMLNIPHVLDLEALAACTRLQHLCLLGYQHRRQPALQLQPLAACGGTLQHLEIQDCNSVGDFTPLAACAALQHLTLGTCRQLVDLTPLAACVALQHLTLGTSSQLVDLSPLAACVRLQQLRLSESPLLQDLAPLAACVQLQTLHLTGCWLLTNLGPLASCVALRELSLTCCHRISNLTPLSSCVWLKVLKLGGCQVLEDLSPLAACTELQELDLEKCRGVVDLGPLAACVALKILVLECCGRVQSLRPLAACLRLEWLHLEGCGAQGRGSLSALPRLRIIQ